MVDRPSVRCGREDKAAAARQRYVQLSPRVSLEPRVIPPSKAPPDRNAPELRDRDEVSDYGKGNGNGTATAATPRQRREHAFKFKDMLGVPKAKAQYTPRILVDPGRYP